jgi:hypothetical protein
MGEAFTRHSLRPLDFEGGVDRITRAENAAGSRSYVCCGASWYETELRASSP